MSVVANVGAMPALGAQIASMVECANACTNVVFDAGEVSEKWSNAYKTAAQPFGIEMNPPPRSAEEAPDHIRTVIPLVREKFDDRIARLFQEPLTKRIIDAQQVDLEQIKVARGMELISEVPANALIQSALLVTNVEQAKSLQPGIIVKGALALGAIAFIPNAIIELFTGSLGTAVMWGVPGIVSAAILANMMVRYIRFHNANDNIASTFNQLLKE